MNSPISYAGSGINWEFLYKVEYQDDLILVLLYIGRFHKYDYARQWTKPIEAYIEIIGDIAIVNDKRLLVEIKQPC